MPEAETTKLVEPEIAVQAETPPAKGKKTPAPAAAPTKYMYSLPTVYWRFDMVMW